MKISLSLKSIVVLAVFSVVAVVPVAAAGGTNAPSPKVIPLEASGKDYIPVLNGPPESVNMRSGLVALAPGRSVGKHSTEQNEELLIVLEGQGEMTFKDGSKLPVKADTAVYCPPETEHNVTNTGTSRLRYVYVVAGAR
jgi:quercetin dioxygenase-like cupin family protein